MKTTTNVQSEDDSHKEKSLIAVYGEIIAGAIMSVGAEDFYLGLD